jgi:hypothetical protein
MVQTDHAHAAWLLVPDIRVSQAGVFFREIDACIEFKGMTGRNLETNAAAKAGLVGVRGDFFDRIAKCFGFQISNDARDQGIIRWGEAVKSERNPIKNKKISVIRRGSVKLSDSMEESRIGVRRANPFRGRYIPGIRLREGKEG